MFKRLFLCKQKNTCTSIKLHENINQEHNLLLRCAFESFTYSIYVVKIVCHASLPFVLNFE